MWERWAVQFAVGFALRQIEKFAAGVDWQLVRSTAEAHAVETVPGTWFDSEAKAVVDAVILGCEAAIKDEADLKLILDDLMAGDPTAALGTLKAMLAKIAMPGKIAAAIALL